VEDPCPAMTRVRDAVDWEDLGGRVKVEMKDGKAALPEEKEVREIAKEFKVTERQVRRVWCVNLVVGAGGVDEEEREKRIKVGLKRWVIKMERENMVNMNKEQKLEYINGIYEEERREIERVGRRVGGRGGGGKENVVGGGEGGKGEKRKRVEGAVATVE
jgi:hypothetical protein